MISIAVDFNGHLVVANQQANTLFGLTLDDCHRPVKELEPGKLMSFHTSIRAFYRNHHPVTLKNIEWIAPHGTTYLDIFITPVFNQKKYLLGVNLIFIIK